MEDELENLRRPAVQVSKERPKFSTEVDSEHLLHRTGDKKHGILTPEDAGCHTREIVDTPK